MVHIPRVSEVENFVNLHRLPYWKSLFTRLKSDSKKINYENVQSHMPHVSNILKYNMNNIGLYDDSIYLHESYYNA